MSKVQYRNMVKAWGDVIGVNNLNLDIPDKEFLVLVGPSGCGKSTALRCLAGLEEITSGEILIGDRVVNDVPPKDRDIAMVFQSYALYPHMTVYDNMAFGLKLRKTPKAEIDKRVQEAAKILGITQLLPRKPKQMSGGQRQRVEPSSVTRRCFYSMSRCLTWMLNCVFKPGLKFLSSTSVWVRPLFMSPTTRSRP